MRRLSPLLSIVLLTPTAVAQTDWTVDHLSAPRGEVVSAIAGDLVLTAGGNDLGVASKVVDVYDPAAESWFQTELTVARWGHAAASLGDLAFFAGGGDPATQQLHDVVDVFDAQTMAWSQAQLSQPRALLAASTVGNKVIFAGGAIDFSGGFSDVVDVYDADLGAPDDPNAWYQMQPLTQARGGISAVTVGDEVLFAGGFDGTVSTSVVDVYDASTDSWRIEHLSKPRLAMCAAASGSQAFFGGGSPMPGGRSDVVDIYDADTQSWSDTKLSAERFGMAATAVGDRVLFAGGAGAFPTIFDVVDVYHVGSGEWEAPQALSAGRFRFAAVTTGGKALFLGGIDSPSSTSDVVDIYDPLGDCVITKYCGAGQNPNNAALIDIATCYAASSSITVSLSNGPPNQFTYLLVGDGNGTASQPPGSNGDLCIVGGSCLGRYDKDIGQISGAGTFGTDIQNALSNPCAGGVNIDPGVTWNFQFWHRMPMGAPSTFSEAISVTFQ